MKYDKIKTPCQLCYVGHRQWPPATAVYVPVKISSASICNYLIMYAAMQKKFVPFSQITYMDIESAETEKSGDFL
jgi:hypothetical protein